MPAHRINIRTSKVTCTCGWVYARSEWLTEWRTNRAITQHLKETK